MGNTHRTAPWTALSGLCRACTTRSMLRESCEHRDLQLVLCLFRLQLSLQSRSCPWLSYMYRFRERRRVVGCAAEYMILT